MNEQMTIFDFDERECNGCKHGVKRSDFDIMAHGKWAYPYICRLTNECQQTTHSCDKWEDKTDDKL